MFCAGGCSIQTPCGGWLIGHTGIVGTCGVPSPQNLAGSVRGGDWGQRGFLAFFSSLPGNQIPCPEGMRYNEFDIIEKDGIQTRSVAYKHHIGIKNPHGKPKLPDHFSGSFPFLPLPIIRITHFSECFCPKYV